MSYKVLVVDDSAILRMSIKRAVVQAGVESDEIFEAGNGQEALDFLDKDLVDLVLLDLNMPIMNGREFVRAVADRPYKEKLKIVVVTTEGNKKRIDEVKSLGVTGVLRKPFEPEDLRAIVGNMKET